MSGIKNTMSAPRRLGEEEGKGSYQALANNLAKRKWRENDGRKGRQREKGGLCFASPFLVNVNALLKPLLFDNNRRNIL